MKSYTRKIAIIVGLFLAFGGISLAIININKNKDDEKQGIVISDAERFETSYEDLNNELIGNTEETYQVVDIDSSNPIHYASSLEVLDLIGSADEAIILIAEPDSGASRSAVPILVDVAKKYNLDTVYYFDINAEKSRWELSEGATVRTSEGTDGYNRFIDLFNEHTHELVLRGEDGLYYPTGSNVLDLPCVLGVKDGQIIREHYGTVWLEEGQSEHTPLNMGQYNDLFNIYDGIVYDIFGLPEVDKFAEEFSE